MFDNHLIDGLVTTKKKEERRLQRIDNEDRNSHD